MTPDDWNALLEPANLWLMCYPVVVAEVKIALDKVPANAPLSTNDLVERLYPDKLVRGAEGSSARQRLFRALAACAEHGLATCVSRAPAEVNSYGGTMQRRVWSAEGTGTGPWEKPGEERRDPRPPKRDMRRRVWKDRIDALEKQVAALQKAQLSNTGPTPSSIA
jgi:hypothetical protein